MADTSGNSLTTVLTARIDRNIEMLADTFANDDHCVSAAVNFPSTPPATINDALYCNWPNEGLDENMGNLKKMLISAKLLSPRKPCKPPTLLYPDQVDRYYTQRT